MMTKQLSTLHYLKYFKLIFLLLLNLFTTVVIGQNHEINFQNYSTKDGLAQNDINCIFQDSKGLIWIGTNNGFSSFDGYEFKNFKMDTHNVPSNLINRIVEDGYGNLWIGTADAGLIRYNPYTGIFKTFYKCKDNPDLFTDNIVSKMVIDQKGNLWFGNTKGLNVIRKKYLDKEEIEVNKFYHNPHNKKSLLSNHITNLYVDTKGTLWVATNKGLQEYIPSKNEVNFGKFRPYIRKKNNNVFGLLEHKGDILVCFYDGIFQLKINGNDYKFTKKNKLRSTLLVKDQSEKIWAGTTNGLYKIEPNIYDKTLDVVQNYNNDNIDVLNFNIITSLLEDNIGVLWIGTNGGGIYKYNPRAKKFKHIKRSHREGSLSYNKVRSIYQDKFQQLWVGTEGGGINLLKDWGKKDFQTGFEAMTVSNTDHAQNIVYSINEWNDEVILGVGYPFKSVAFNNKKQMKSGFPNLNKEFHPSDHNNASFYIQPENDSLIWMGSYGGGLLKGVKDKKGNVQWSKLELVDEKETGEVIEIIRNILLDSKGNLWLGTRKGLCFVSSEEKLKEKPEIKLFQNSEEESSLSYNYVIPVFEASNGEIWTGTMGGGLNIITDLSNINKVKFDHFTTNDGLASNVIKAILEDNYNNIWVSTNKGLSKINLKSRKVKNYDVSDGLQDNEFSELAAFKGKTGELFFGGVNGINVFHPHEIVDDNTISDLVFTELNVLNSTIDPNVPLDDNVILKRSISETDQIKLLYNQNSFSVKFAYLHYGAPLNNNYKYRLIGFDDQWVTADVLQREAKYTNLSPGNYTLQVKGANGDNIWNPNMLTLQIQVLPPWWLTWWAKGIYFILLIVLLVFFSRYSIITARKKSQLEMAKFEREKLEDLSQLKLQFFTNISHELRTPLTLIHTPIEQLIKRGRNLSEHEKEKSYQLIYRNVQHLMRLVNQLLDFRKVDQGKMKLKLVRGNWNTFVEQVYHSFKEFAEHENINFTLDTGGQDIHGFMDNDKLEKILYNLLSNAFKYTYEGEINLSLKKVDDKVQFILKDTGIGISKEKQQNIFNPFYQVDNMKKAKNRGTGIGLAFTKSLVELHNGTIRLESEVNQGTTFYLEFPLTIENYNEAEICEEVVETIETMTPEEEYVNSSNKPKIVVIDDNRSIRELLQSLLEENYDVYLAEDGEKGLSLAKEVMPNLVLSDIMMPILDGYELTKKIREDSQLCHLPIILLTAKNSEVSKLKGYEYGVDAYVTKPFNSDVLLARIHALIENRNNQQKRFRTGIDVQPSEITFTSIDEKFLNRLVSIVEDNISDSDFTVEKLALEYGATPLRLNQKLKALTGQTAKGFIRNIRLKRAAQMLKLGRYSVSDVTYEVGFKDLKYFRNCFKKEFGVPPSHYLKDGVHEGEEDLELEENL